MVAVREGRLHRRSAGERQAAITQRLWSKGEHAVRPITPVSLWLDRQPEMSCVEGKGRGLWQLTIKNRLTAVCRPPLRAEDALSCLWKHCAFWCFTAWLHDGFRECDLSRNSVVEKFGRELLGSFPKDSLILTRGDLPGNSLRYLHYCQGTRADIRLVDQEVRATILFSLYHCS